MKTTKNYTLHIICGMILFAALFSCTNAPKGEELYNNNKYTLTQPDSPHLPNYHPEIDLISNDTIYVNWYSNDKEPFYDGEGNVIPDKIVRLFVQSQFVKMTKPETDSVNKYFYFNK